MILRPPNAGPAALSFAQQRLWMLDALYPNSSVYATRTAYTIRGELDLAALRSALEAIVRRHEVFRTTFEVIDGEPHQIVALPGEISLPVFEFANAPVDDVVRHVHEEGIRPFDLRRGPLIRAAVFRRGPRENVLLIGMHHIAFDESSIPTFNRELSAGYAAYHRGIALDLPDPPIPYREFADRQRERIQRGLADTELAYWRAQLAGAPARIELPLDRQRPVIARFRGAVTAIVLSPALKERVLGLGRELGGTLFMTLLAAFNVLMYRYTGQSDLVVGSPVANRSRTELEGAIGLFVNTVALRTRLGSGFTFRDTLREVRETAISAYDNQELPFERVIAELRPERSLNGTPFVNVMFVARAAPIAPLELEGLELERFSLPSTTARFDLSMRVTDEPQGLVCSLQYDVDLFDAPTIDRLLAHYENLLESITRPGGVDLPISRLAMLSGAEYRALTVDANQTQASYPSEITFPRLFAEQAARSKDAVALVCGQSRLTYAQLDEASSGVARMLSRRGVLPRSRVGIFLSRSPDLIIGLLGVLKLGCAYVPLDPTYPRHRLEFTVQDAELAAIVTESWRDEPFLSGLAARRVLRIDLDAAAAEPEESEALPAAAAGDDVAYSIYTSGSTGTPKAVDVPHRALANLLLSTRERPGLGATDSLVALTTICFDFSVFQIFLPLVVGATLVLATDEAAGDPAAILELLVSSEATVLFATPGMWQMLIDTGWRGGTVKKMLVGGEPLPRALADQLLARGDELWNLYGPTETTVLSSAARIEPGPDIISIGSPISNTQFYILDGSGELTPPGVVGELFIGGHGVALGYHGRPDLTQERFVPDPFGPDRLGRLYRTGDLVRRRGSILEFIGRSDQQIKLRGFRIELEEIAAALRAQPGVIDAVALIAGDSRGDPSIHAYVLGDSAARPPGPDWPATLRAEARRVLPRYMVPGAIVLVDEFPRLPNGKLDRQSLAKLDADTRATAGTMATDAQGLIAEIVAELLGRADIAATDDLFDKGLHSVLAVRLVLRIKEVFRVRLPLQAVFKRPTVEGLADELDSSGNPARSVQADGPVLRLNDAGTETPLFFLHNDTSHGGAYCSRLAVALGGAQPLFAVAPHGAGGLPEVLSVEVMAQNYYRLLKELQPLGPYRVGGFCFGGMVAFELARMLAAGGDAVEHLIIINRDAPLGVRIPGYDALVRRICLNARLNGRVRRALLGLALLVPLAAQRGIGAVLRLIGVWLKRRFPELEVGIRQTREQREESYFARRLLAATYHPARYDGTVTLIWSSGEELRAQGDSTRGDITVGWAKLAAAVRVIPMPGHHLSPVSEGVVQLGALLRAILRRER